MTVRNCAWVAEGVRPLFSKPKRRQTPSTIAHGYLVGDDAFPQTISLFTLERASMKLRFGRAILEGISQLDQLNNSLEGTGHRLRLTGSRIEMPIQFYNVVAETEMFQLRVLWVGSDQAPLSDNNLWGRAKRSTPATHVAEVLPHDFRRARPGGIATGQLQMQ